MTETLYYLSDYSDEVMPCDCTLDGWAKWLSAPSEERSRTRAAEHGERFASAVCVITDARAVRVGDKWTFPDGLPAHDWAAVRYGPGMGWDVDTLAASAEEALGEADGLDLTEDAEIVACAKDQAPVILEYRHEDGKEPELVVLGAVQ